MLNVRVLFATVPHRMQPFEVPAHGIKHDLPVDVDLELTVFGAAQRIFVVEGHGHVNIIFFQQRKIML